MIWGSLQEKLPNLSKVALAVLTIPHSNAGEERGFSIIRKNKTDFRFNLDLRRSLSSIMTIKMNKPANLLPCHRFKPSNKPANKMQSSMQRIQQSPCHCSGTTLNAGYVLWTLVLQLFMNF